MYLFLDKYKGNNGLAGYLNTSMGSNSENPTKVKLGIKGTMEDLKERKKKWGVNEFAQPKTRSIM